MRVSASRRVSDFTILYPYITISSDFNFTRAKETLANHTGLTVSMFHFLALYKGLGILGKHIQPRITMEK